MQKIPEAAPNRPGASLFFSSWGISVSSLDAPATGQPQHRERHLLQVFCSATGFQGCPGLQLPFLARIPSCNEGLRPRSAGKGLSLISWTQVPAVGQGHPARVKSFHRCRLSKAMGPHVCCQGGGGICDREARRSLPLSPAMICLCC